MRRNVWLAVLLIAGCAKPVTEEPQESSPTDIAATAGETSYPMDHLGVGTIRLTNGAYQDSAAGLSVRVETSATGDLDGDGREDAAVVLASQTGGSGTFVDLYSVLDRETGIVTRGPAPLGDRVKVDSLRISDRAIRLHILTHAPDDPLCCPTQRAAETFVLHADTLMRRPAEQP